MSRLGPRSRWSVYGIALVATLIAMRWADGQDETVARPAREQAAQAAAPRAATPRGADAVPPLDLSGLNARTPNRSDRDLFPAIDWSQVARAEELRRNPPSRPAPPPPPQAPPAPFKYMGKMIEDGRTTLFLVQGERNLVVREGETLQGTWRVDRIADDAMTLTYLPLGKAQVVPFPIAGAPAGPAPARAPVPDPGSQRDNSDKDD
jgi:hypothetical protein